MSNQSLRQASIRAVTGTTHDHNGDWHALFDYVGIAAGPFGQRMLAWINSRLGVTYTNLNDAEAALAAAEGVSLFNQIGTFNAAAPAWVVSGAIVDLDFVNQRYWWNRSARASSEFTTFTGGTFSSGLVLDGTASQDISIARASTGLSVPCSIHASFTPAAVSATMYAAALDIDGNNFFFAGTSATSPRCQLMTANVNQALLSAATAASAGVRITVGGQMETNNILQAVNGAIGGAADTVATVFTPTTLRIGERVGGSAGLNGTIRRITAFNGTKNQTQLNAESALVHATT